MCMFCEMRDLVKESEQLYICYGVNGLEKISHTLRVCGETANGEEETQAESESVCSLMELCSRFCRHARDRQLDYKYKKRRRLMKTTATDAAA